MKIQINLPSDVFLASLSSRKFVVFQRHLKRILELRSGMVGASDLCFGLVFCQKDKTVFCSLRALLCGWGKGEGRGFTLCTGQQILFVQLKVMKEIFRVIFS